MRSDDGDESEGVGDIAADSGYLGQRSSYCGSRGVVYSGGWLPLHCGFFPL